MRGRCRSCMTDATEAWRMWFVDVWHLRLSTCGEDYHPSHPRPLSRPLHRCLWVSFLFSASFTIIREWIQPVHSTIKSREVSLIILSYCKKILMINQKYYRAWKNAVTSYSQSLRKKRQAKEENFFTPDWLRLGTIYDGMRTHRCWQLPQTWLNSPLHILWVFKPRFTARSDL